MLNMKNRLQGMNLMLTAQGGSEREFVNDKCLSPFNVNGFSSNDCVFSGNLGISSVWFMLQ